MRRARWVGALAGTAVVVVLGLVAGCGAGDSLGVVGTSDPGASTRLTGGSIPGGTGVQLEAYSLPKSGTDGAGSRSASVVASPAAWCWAQLKLASGRSLWAVTDGAGVAQFVGVPLGSFSLTVWPPFGRSDLSPLTVTAARTDPAADVLVLGVMGPNGSPDDGAIRLEANDTIVSPGESSDVVANVASGSVPAAGSSLAWVLETRTGAELTLDVTNVRHAVIRSGSTRGTALVAGHFGPASSSCTFSLR
ncbi:MAG TPA: hypothetical protein PLD23_08280 [Armatimonadota bacterium]|nr:hypothetical protein [Armatimonadota bacterium]